MSGSDAEPWIGDAYRDPVHRHLVLGESSHDSGRIGSDGWLRTRCRDQIKAFIEPEDAGTPEHPKGYRTPNFERGLTQVLGGQLLARKWKRSCDRQRVWERFAFINYITDSVVAGGAGRRPTEPQWASGAANYGSMLANLEPTHILVVGFQTWDRILSAYRENITVQDRTSDCRPSRVKYRSGERTLWMSRICHPGGYGRFFWRDEARVAAQFFGMV